MRDYVPATKTDKWDRIAQHGRELLDIFPDAQERDPVKLCKKLRRLEVKAHRLAEQWCNGDIDETTWVKGSDDCLTTAIGILCPERSLGDALFVNGDPRGYALKINDRFMRDSGAKLHRDWGGCGILAPEIK